MCSSRQLSGSHAHTWPICSPSEVTGSPRQIKEMGTGSAVSQPTAADSCRLPLTAACHASDLLSACWLQGWGRAEWGEVGGGQVLGGGGREVLERVRLVWKVSCRSLFQGLVQENLVCVCGVVTGPYSKWDHNGYRIVNSNSCLHAAVGLMPYEIHEPSCVSYDLYVIY